VLEQLEVRELMSADMPVGMNLADLVDWDPAWVFKDVFKSSREWISHGYNTATRVTDWAGGANVPVAVDEHGWPTQLASWTNAAGQRIEQRIGTLMFRELNGAYPGGVYTAEWDGTGTVTWGMDARAIATGRTAAGRNFARLQVTPGNGGIYMRIDATNPADPIRNVNVWMPDHNGESFVGHTWRPGDNGTPFHPRFLERLAPFDTIRAIHPSDTIESDIVRWSDRREVDDARQSTAMNPFRNGWAPEYQIELCNELDANCYFNMPHMADDDYVRNFATMVRDTLEPDLTAYVEWSNEVWNFAPGFEATFWVRDQTLLPENAGLSHWQIVARETKRDLDIWTSVFAGQSERLVRVVGGFAAVPWITNQVAQHVGDSFDAIAIAPYIGPNAATRATYTAATTPDQILNDTAATISFMSGVTTQHRQMADRYGTQFGRHVQLITYEAGMHLDGRNQPYQTAMYQAGLLPRSYDIYRDYMDAMHDAGVELFMHFNFTGRARASQWGDFAALHSMDEPLATAHKYRALVDYMAEQSGSIDPPPPAPAPPTVTITATDPTAAEAGRDPAVVTVARTGPTDQSLTVRFAVSGTARDGVDFDSIGDSVVIPAGAASAAITIRPVDDALADGRETVTVTLAACTCYELGSTPAASATITDNDAARLPVLMVIANRDFYYREYAETRASIEAAGMRVVVAAARRVNSTPHANSGQPAGGGSVMPNLALSQVRAADYASVVFVGGWGSSAYQYAFSGRYTNAAYNGDAATRRLVNQLITDMVLTDKYVAAICHGVTVLGWSRVDSNRNGVIDAGESSPLAGRTVSAYGGGAPASNVTGSTSTRWHIEQNGATMVASRSIGDRTTAVDDVLVDGKIITAENYDSARLFGQTIADSLRN
jgi:putative intracellular protease/amidase